MAHNEAHTALVNAALDALALNGYTAYKNETGAWFEDSGRVHKYGKKGSADIICLMPPRGRHVECEAKTGVGKQSPGQIKHQKFVVERNGGVYILFRDVDFLLHQLAILRAYEAGLIFR